MLARLAKSYTLIFFPECLLRGVAALVCMCHDGHHRRWSYWLGHTSISVSWLELTESKIKQMTISHQRWGVHMTDHKDKEQVTFLIWVWWQCSGNNGICAQNVSSDGTHACPFLGQKKWAQEQWWLFSSLILTLIYCTLLCYWRGLYSLAKLKPYFFYLQNLNHYLSADTCG